MTEAEALTIAGTCLERIRSKYERKGQSLAWTDATRSEFLRAFTMVPTSLLACVVDEVLLNPPRDDRGREVNFLPDPSDIVTVGRRMAQESEGDTVAAAVAEIWEKIARFGRAGQLHESGRYRVEGAPRLSPLARHIVDTLGGWLQVCSEETPKGVFQGQMMSVGRELVQEESRRPLFTRQETSSPRLEPRERSGRLERIPR